MQTEIIPAILVKKREDLLRQIEIVMPYVRTVQIDIMDGKFVPNKTIGLEELKGLPENINYEFHWMVADPANWAGAIKGDVLHLVHIETIGKANSWEEIKNSVLESGGRLGIAINPETSLDKLLEYEDELEYVLFMTVNPGFSGQNYIFNVEHKITKLRKLKPHLDIEVDGGINKETIVGAVKAGANKIVAASAIFAADNAVQAINELAEIAKSCD